MIRLGVVGHQGYAGLADVIGTLRRRAPELGLILSYEDDLSEGLEASVRRVLRHLDLSAPAGWQPPKHMSRQADERSERWVAQYRDRTPTQLA